MPKGKKITISDTRKVSPASSKSGEYDYETMANVVKAAKDEGVDPWTALSVAMQETKMGQLHPNLGQVNMSALQKNPQRLADLQNSIKDSKDDVYKHSRALAFMLKSSLADADKAGKTDEAQRIQAYNGYGKIGLNNDIGAKTMYGVDLTKNTIDMSKTPLYGQTIVDLRDNVLKQNPQIKELVDAYNLPQDELNAINIEHQPSDNGKVKYTFKKGDQVVSQAEDDPTDFTTAAAKAAYLRTLYLRSKQPPALAVADRVRSVIQR